MRAQHVRAVLCEQLVIRRTTALFRCHLEQIPVRLIHIHVPTLRIFHEGERWSILHEKPETCRIRFRTGSDHLG